MNRYGRGPTIGGPSRATATTLCQKCLKKGHYSYECKAGAQERPYVSRPSRTQQLLNPKLVPKLNSEVPQELLRKKGIADEQLAKAEMERGLKRERQSEDEDEGGNAKRKRSASVSSVSTISTGISRSPSPAPDYDGRSKAHASRAAPSVRTRSPSPYRSPLRQTYTDPEKKRRRDSISSPESYASDDRRDVREVSRERAPSRSTRRRYQELSPERRGRRAESRSSHGERRRLSNDRPPGRDGYRDDPPARRGFNDRNGFNGNRGPPPRERSLSPFSKRLALTQAMNSGGR